MREVCAALRLDRRQHVAEALEGAAGVQGPEDPVGRGPPLLPAPPHPGPTPLRGRGLGEDEVKEAREAAALVAAAFEDRGYGLLHGLDLHPVPLDELRQDLRHGVRDLGLQADGHDVLQDPVLLLDGYAHCGPHLDPILPGVGDDALSGQAVKVALQGVLVDLPLRRDDLLRPELAEHGVQWVDVGELLPGLRPLWRVCGLRCAVGLLRRRRRRLGRRLLGHRLLAHRLLRQGALREGAGGGAGRHLRHLRGRCSWWSLRRRRRPWPLLGHPRLGGRLRRGRDLRHPADLRHARLRHRRLRNCALGRRRRLRQLQRPRACGGILRQRSPPDACPLRHGC
mmetsp:Transcript_43389/g.122653  ORF Transcript_43389/g.122653 Transcript_43389/m.122653 type:complete len:339 (+) Transcript_43389:210-1226(+)